MAFEKIKNMFSGSSNDESLEDEYLEIDLEQEKKNNKVMVKLFVLNTYEDSNLILNAIREGYTIAVIDIKGLKKKDPIELKRAISKIKKTADALEGSIAGFGDTTVIVTPAFASIDKEISRPKPEEKRRFEDF
ncbi:MAG: cell division protein SepF [Nanoarchaeota archaeon]|nr:cell division protein SepF [Nanoarchaeota archaeon]